MDDVSVGSGTAENHLRELSLVMTRLEDAVIKVNFSKCHFGTPEAIVLGNVVYKNGIRPPEEQCES